MRARVVNERLYYVKNMRAGIATERLCCVKHMVTEHPTRCGQV